MATIHEHDRYDARREANRWLAKRLSWEDRLRDLRAEAGHEPATPTRSWTKRPSAAA